MASGVCLRAGNPAHDVKSSTLVRKERSASPVHNIWKLYILRANTSVISSCTSDFLKKLRQLLT